MVHENVLHDSEPDSPLNGKARSMVDSFCFERKSPSPKAEASPEVQRRLPSVLHAIDTCVLEEACCMLQHRVITRATMISTKVAAPPGLAM